MTNQTVLLQLQLWIYECTKLWISWWVETHFRSNIAFTSWENQTLFRDLKNQLNKKNFLKKENEDWRLIDDWCLLKEVWGANEWRVWQTKVKGIRFFIFVTTHPQQTATPPPFSKSRCHQYVMQNFSSVLYPFTKLQLH